MSWSDFLIIFVTCVVTMALCRVVPLFLLKGKELPEGLSRALGFIPPAAFAALVANDLFSPNMFDAGLWQGAIPLIAASLVVLVATKTKSLIWCIVIGVVSFALLLLV